MPRASALSATLALAAVLGAAAPATATTATTVVTATAQATTTTHLTASAAGSAANHPAPPARGTGGAGLNLVLRPTNTGSNAKATPKAKAKAKSKRASAKKRVYRLGDRALHQGMSGNDVQMLQAYLTLAGYQTTIDGSFADSTKKSVIELEAANELTADGVASLPLQKLLISKVQSIIVDPPVSATRINPDGTATAPVGAPAIVQNVVAAANQIIGKPYIYGGGHGQWNDAGYDCSGAVSYALHGGGLLDTPGDSSTLESYGAPGPGHWITIYANSGHAWIVVAGRAFDTANFGGPNIPAGSGPRWRTAPTGNLNDGTGGYVVRHPIGL